MRFNDKNIDIKLNNNFLDIRFHQFQVNSPPTRRKFWK